MTDNPAGTSTGDDVAERVCAIWRRVLDSDRIGPDQNFFDAGGTSVTLIALHIGLTAEFGLDDLPLLSLFENPTVRAFARYLQQADGSAADAAAGPVRAAAARAAAPGRLPGRRAGGR